MPQTEPSKTILVADDEAHIRHVVGLKLRKAGFTVVQARDGREALGIAAAGRVDLLITDFHMPHLTGVELCERLREEGKSMPTILLTARGHDLVPGDVERVGIGRVMSKPFSPRQLVREVEAMLAGREAA